MMSETEIKKLVRSFEADLCGIASADRLDDAPEGFRPLDIMPSCRSVVVFAKKWPRDSIFEEDLGYTETRNNLMADLKKITADTIKALKKAGIAAVSVSSNNSIVDKRTGRYHAPISLKHCAVAAGLGRIGKNTIVVTPEYGNMIWLGAILTDAAWEPDEPLSGSPCEEGCTVCADICPVHAVGSSELDQKACANLAYRVPRKGERFAIKCRACRASCPNRFGSLNNLPVSVE
jgi:epoxyqueuosine reductase QueG